jgi:hypothetical protein
MQNFLSSSTKVRLIKVKKKSKLYFYKLIEKILQEKKAMNNKILTTSKQSKLDFCNGYKSASLPDIFSSFETSPISNCAFCTNDQQYFVVSFSYKLKVDYFNKTILIVWNIDELETPYRFLTQEGVSTSCCFSSSLVFSGNVNKQNKKTFY